MAAAERNQISNSQKTPHIWPLQVNYWVSNVRIYEKIDHIMMVLQVAFVWVTATLK